MEYNEEIKTNGKSLDFPKHENKIKDNVHQIYNGAEIPKENFKVNKGEMSQFPGQNTEIKNKIVVGSHSGYRKGRLLSFEEFISNNISLKKYDKNTIDKESIKKLKN